MADERRQVSDPMDGGMSEVIEHHRIKAAKYAKAAAWQEQCAKDAAGMMHEHHTMRAVNLRAGQAKHAEYVRCLADALEALRAAKATAAEISNGPVDIAACKWEYKQLRMIWADFDFFKRTQELGEAGWELMGWEADSGGRPVVEDVIAVFKRSKALQCDAGGN